MRFRIVPVWALSLIVVVLAALGCGQIRIVSENEPPVANAVRPAHDVAITAVDLDPPVPSVRALAQRADALLIVIENRGTEPEQDLLLVVSLTGENAGDILLRAERRINGLGAGESRLERFTVEWPVAFRPTYRLQVRLETASPDANPANNVRLYQFDFSPS